MGRPLTYAWAVTMTPGAPDTSTGSGGSFSFAPASRGHLRDHADGVGARRREQLRQGRRLGHGRAPVLPAVEPDRGLRQLRRRRHRLRRRRRTRPVLPGEHHRRLGQRRRRLRQPRHLRRHSRRLRHARALRRGAGGGGGVRERDRDRAPALCQRRGRRLRLAPAGAPRRHAGGAAPGAALLAVGRAGGVDRSRPAAATRSTPPPSPTARRATPCARRPR